MFFGVWWFFFDFDLDSFIFISFYLCAWFFCLFLVSSYSFFVQYISRRNCEEKIKIKSRCNAPITVFFCRFCYWFHWVHYCYWLYLNHSCVRDRIAVMQISPLSWVGSSEMQKWMPIDWNADFVSDFQSKLARVELFESRVCVCVCVCVCVYVYVIHCVLTLYVDGKTFWIKAG